MKPVHSRLPSPSPALPPAALPPAALPRPARPPLSRRHFLRGLGGVTLGLPFLEALAPRSARAQAATTIQRFGVFFACNGVDMTRWFPNGAYGALTPEHLTGTANEALAPFVRKLGKSLSLA